MGAPEQVSGAFSFGRAVLGRSMVLGVAVITIAALPAGASRAETPPAMNLAQLVSALDGAGPLTARKLSRLLGSLRCGRGSSCRGGPVHLRDIVIGEVDFRRYDGGTLLILDHLAGSCILPRAVLPASASLSLPTNGCTDGVTCLYRSADRPWGTLRLGVSDARASACVRSVVIDRRD